MDMTDLYKNLLINSFRGTSITAPATIYLALFTTATSDSAGGTEVTGGGYARQPVTFIAPPTPGVSNNSAIVTFTNFAALTTVTHAALMTHLTNSYATSAWMHGPLVTPKAVAAGADLPIAAGDIDLTFN